jgi:hypothetical protein
VKRNQTTNIKNDENLGIGIHKKFLNFRENFIEKSAADVGGASGHLRICFSGSPKSPAAVWWWLSPPKADLWNVNPAVADKLLAGHTFIIVVHGLCLLLVSCFLPPAAMFAASKHNIL